jgi:hypothetical protein
LIIYLSHFIIDQEEIESKLFIRRNVTKRTKTRTELLPVENLNKSLVSGMKRILDDSKMLISDLEIFSKTEKVGLLVLI